MTEDLLTIPQSFCQECRLCCRFLEPDRQTPFASRPDLGSILPENFQGAPNPELIPVRIEEFDLWQCALLEESSWSCRSWPKHPLDCRIYPLLIILHEGSPWLGIDTNCPFSIHLSQETLHEKAETIRHNEWPQLSAQARTKLITHLEKESAEGVLPLLPLET
ncbi:MAG: YkgJ family cysteine cluster protein [Leptospirillum sp.]|jgi:Fe-S-cluster containining protein|nr:hypothetical protein [Nitrospiraceae bacterium]MDA8149547.1 hypothetical protein [Nitrospiraceae bacterium]